MDSKQVEVKKDVRNLINELESSDRMDHAFFFASLLSKESLK